jgi:hypothetical protein
LSLSCRSIAFIKPSSTVHLWSFNNFYWWNFVKHCSNFRRSLVRFQHFFAFKPRPSIRRRNNYWFENYGNWNFTIFHTIIKALWRDDARWTWREFCGERRDRRRKVRDSIQMELFLSRNDSLINRLFPFRYDTGMDLWLQFLISSR